MAINAPLHCRLGHGVDPGAAAVYLRATSYEL
jgi:hypothetical protein